MLVKNSGTSIIRLAIKGSIIEIKGQQYCDIDEKIYDMYKKIFPALVPDEESVVICSKAESIEKPAEAKKPTKKPAAKKKK